MSPAAPSAPQLSRIARLLGVDVADLAGHDELSRLPVEDLRILHDQINDTIHRGSRERFAAVAALAAKLPGPAAGRLAEKFLPPVLAARVCEHLEPARARDLVARVHLPYLAEIAVALDPVRSRAVVEAIPAQRIGEVAGELFARREYAAMAEFVRVVDVEALFAAIGAATPHDLVAIAPLLEWSDDLNHVVAHLPEAQLKQIVDELDHEELADLALALDPTRFGPVVARVDAQTVAALTKVLLDRKEHEAMARFAEVLPDELLTAALTVMRPTDLDLVVPHLDDELVKLVEAHTGKAGDRRGEVTAAGDGAALPMGGA